MKIRRRIRLDSGWADCDMRHMVRIGDRVIPSRIEVTFPSTADLWPSLHAVIEVRDGAPVCTEMTIRAHPEGRDVRTQDFRAVAIDDWIDVIVAEAAEQIIEDEGGRSAVVYRGASKTDAEAAATKKIIGTARRNARRTVNRKLLEQVAEIYRAHQDDKPTEAIRRAFGVSERSASRYAKLAEEAGLLPTTTPGKKRI